MVEPRAGNIPRLRHVVASVLARGRFGVLRRAAGRAGASQASLIFMLSDGHGPAVQGLAREVYAAFVMPVSSLRAYVDPTIFLFQSVGAISCHAAMCGTCTCTVRVGHGDVRYEKDSVPCAQAHVWFLGLCACVFVCVRMWHWKLWVCWEVGL